MIKSVTDSDFNDVVLKSSKPVLVDFWATFCGQCRALTPFVEKLAAERGDILFVKADLTKCENTADAYHVQSLPCVLFFRDGVEFERVLGNNQSKITEIINSVN